MVSRGLAFFHMPLDKIRSDWKEKGMGHHQHAAVVLRHMNWQDLHENGAMVVRGRSEISSLRCSRAYAILGCELVCVPLVL